MASSIGGNVPPPKRPFFSYSPLKEVYILVHMMCTCVFHLPFWVLLYTSNHRRPVKEWPLGRCVHVRLIRRLTGMATATGITVGKSVEQAVKQSTLKSSRFVWIPPVSTDLITGFLKEKAEATGLSSIQVPGYWYERDHRPATKSDNETTFTIKAGSTDKVILHLHGGAYLLGAAHEADRATSVLTKGLFEKTNIQRIFTVEYRLCGTAPFPAQLIDALSGYAYLTGDCGFKPDNIIVSGDSAGGNLALALTRYLRDSLVRPLPAGLLLLSPWCDMTGTTRYKDSNASGYVNVGKDILEGTLGVIAVQNFLRGHSTTLLSHPYLSPARLVPPPPSPDPSKPLFAAFPPVYIASGACDQLRDEIRLVEERMKNDGVDVELNEVEGAVHDFMTFMWMEPDRSKGLGRLGGGWKKG